MSDTRTISVTLSVGKLKHPWTILPNGMEGDANVLLHVGFWCKQEGTFHQAVLRARSTQPIPTTGGFTRYRQMLFDQLSKMLSQITNLRTLFVLDVIAC